MFRLAKRFNFLSLHFSNLCKKSYFQLTPAFYPRHFYSTMENDPNQNGSPSVLGKRTAEERREDNIINPVEETAEAQTGDNENENKSDLGDDSKIESHEIDPLRVCLQGLDPFTRDRDLLKFCKSEFSPPIDLTGVNKKMKQSHAFISFKTTEDRERFEKEISDKKIKNRKVKVRPVRSDHQSLKHEKKAKKIEEEVGSSRIKQATPEEIEAEMSQPIQEKVCPLWKTPYEEQLKSKREAMDNVLKKINTNAAKILQQEDKTGSNIPYWIKENPNGGCVELSDFIGADSDKTFYYRNKAEFTVGESYLEKGKTKVGFNVGNFNKGFMFVESAVDCAVVSKESLQLAQVLENYIHESGVPAYHRMTHVGFWRALVVRQSDQTKEILISVVVAKESLEPEKYQKVREDLQNIFVKGFTGEHKIVSVLVQDHNGASDNVPNDAPYEIIYGDQDFYMDEIMGFKFRVNVSAFLQVNSSQCDKLYNLVKKLSGTDNETIFLDICCGIGTIGICSASHAKKIVGIEMVDRAIQDANYNSQLNGLSNTEFHAAKVESVIGEVIKPYMGANKIIGVVDPPRAGLHKDVIKGLRTCKGLDKLIYVSCNPEGTMIENVLGLCLPETKKRRAPPFTITEAYGVDLFPQTNHFEGVLVLERLYNQRKPKKDA